MNETPNHSLSTMEGEYFELLPPMQQQFVRTYVLTGDKKQAAKEAGYRNPAIAGNRLLKDPKVRAALERIWGQVEDVEVASAQETLSHLTAILRNQNAPMKERRQAAALILRAKGVGGPEVDARSQTVNLMLGADVPLEHLDLLDFLSRLMAANVPKWSEEAGMLLAQMAPGALPSEP